MKHEVTYQSGNGHKYIKEYDCKTAGEAFALCQKDKPGCKMISARRIGGSQSIGWAWTCYEAPPVQRDSQPDPKPPRPLKRDDRSCVLPFYDEVVRQGQPE